MFYLRFALDFVSNLVEHNGGGVMGRLLVLPLGLLWWKNLRGPEPLTITMGFTYRSNCSTLAPSLTTFHSVLPEEMSRTKEPAGPIFYHSHFQLLVICLLKGELSALITSVPTLVSTSGTFSPQEKEAIFCFLLVSPRRVCCKSCHSVFTSRATGKY